ncbi:MAG: Thivi_2564 family membrane protein [Terriglobia bacterium]
MPLMQILAAPIVMSVPLWLVNQFMPMQPSIKSLMNAVVFMVAVLWLLNVFGLFHSLSSIHAGIRMRRGEIT